MTKGEIFLLDTCQIGPTVLFLNQYFNYLIPEIWILWLSLVRKFHHQEIDLAIIKFFIKSDNCVVRPNKVLQ